MRTKSRVSFSSGFTLTELLVVMVILATLVALAFMGLRRVRDMADKTGAIRNLSQLQIANVSYATDNGGNYVPKQFNDEKGNRAGWWFQVPEFLNHLRGEFPIPDDKPLETVPHSLLDPKVVRAKRELYYSLAGSFGINETNLPTSQGPNARPANTVENVTRPDQSMAFATATDLGVRYPARLTWFARAPDKREGKTKDGGLAYRHGDKIVVVYFDGHVGELSKAEMEEIDRSKGGVDSPFWRPKP